MKLTILIPAYNEQAGLGQVLTGLTERYRDLAEIIVVNDGSTDGTARVAESFPPVITLHHRFNMGYGRAIKTGVAKASHDLICLFDADGQHRADDVQRLLDNLGEAHMIVGARGGGAYRDLVRAPGKIVLHLLANLLSGQKISDLNSGLRLFRRHVVSQYAHLLPNGFSASTTMTMALLARGYKIKYLPIATAPRTGKSQVRQLRDGPKTILLMLRMVLLFNPLKFFLPLSGILFLGGWVYGVFKFIQTGLGLSVGALLTIGSGLATFVMGLLFDQISSLRLERYETGGHDDFLRPGVGQEDGPPRKAA